MKNHDHVPGDLRAQASWVSWQCETRDGKPTKAPINPRTGQHAKVNDATTWTDYETAVASVENHRLAGAGYVFSVDDPICGVDIDDCRDPQSGEIAPWAQEIIDAISTYWEVSPSGTGVKGWLVGELSGTRRRWRVEGGEVEIYVRGRFFTFTGEHLAETPSEVQDCQAALDALAARLEAQRTAGKAETTKRSKKTELTDAAILDRLKRAKRMAPLLRGDLSAYDDDQSSADLALCGAIARIVNGDRERIDAIFRKTALMRDKWDERHASDGTTYGQMTIAKALEEVVYPVESGQKEILLALARGLEYLRTPDGEGFVVVPSEDHFELLSVMGRDFGLWLRHQYFLREGKGATSAVLKDVQTTLDAGARYNGAERRIDVRVMEHEGALYVNLANRRREAVRITPQGWGVVDNPLLFRQTNSMRPLPRPESGGLLTEMRALLNLEEVDDFVLAVGWLVGALHPRGPYPVLIVQGEQGSAKSVTTRLLRSLIDPAMPDLKSLPSSDRDLMIAARGSWLLAYDNLSGLKPGMSDALCRLATGGGLSTRQLYTDAEEMVFEAKRPIIINGIDDLTQRADLLSRSIVLMLPSIEPEARRTEGEVLAEFEALRPRLLGALCDAVACALAQRDTVKLETKPRMSDFATWVAAAEEKLPWGKGEFLSALLANAEAMSDMALELDGVGMWIIELMQGTARWTDTAAGMLKMLQDSLGDYAHVGDIPHTARGFGNRLRRLAPQLRERGIIVKYKKGTERNIIITNLHGPAGRYIEGGARVTFRPLPGGDE